MNKNETITKRQSSGLRAVTAKVVEVVEVIVKEGDGSELDPYRFVTYYFSEGNLLVCSNLMNCDLPTAIEEAMSLAYEKGREAERKGYEEATDSS